MNTVVKYLDTKSLVKIIALDTEYQTKWHLQTSNARAFPFSEPQKLFLWKSVLLKFMQVF